MNFWIVITGLGVLGFIFLKHYLRLEKGISIGSYFSRNRRLVHHRVNEPDSADVTVDEMIISADKVSPKDAARADILIKKAELNLDRGEIKQAEKMLIQALSLNPGAMEAYNKLGIIYLRLNQFGKAESIYRKLVLTVLTDPSYFSNLGLALYQQGKLQEAKTYYKKAIALDSERAGRFFSLSQIMRELGELDEALQHLKRAVEMEPRNLDYLLSLAQFYFDIGLHPEAKQLVSEILLIAPGNEMALLLADKMKG